MHARSYQPAGGFREESRLDPDPAPISSSAPARAPSPTVVVEPLGEPDRKKKRKREDAGDAMRLGVDENSNKKKKNKQRGEPGTDDALPAFQSVPEEWTGTGVREERTKKERKDAKEHDPPKKSRKERKRRTAPDSDSDSEIEVGSTEEKRDDEPPEGVTGAAEPEKTDGSRKKKEKRSRSKPGKEPYSVEDPDQDRQTMSELADINGTGPAEPTTTTDIRILQTVDGEDAAKREKKKKKRKRTDDNRDVGLDPDDGGGGGGRHKSVLDKKSKSLRLAARKAADNEPRPEIPHRDGDAVPDEPASVHGLGPLPQAEPAQPDASKPSYSTLPPWLSSPVRVSHSTRTPFASLGVPPAACRLLASKGFPDAFAVQTAAIPLLTPSNATLPGDVLIAAATGSGKTLAYALPVARDVSLGVLTRLRAVVVLPTRELVRQAREVFELCGRAWGEEQGRRKIKVGMAVGSQTLRQEQEAMVGRELCFDPEARRRLDAQRADDEDDPEEDDGLLPGHVWEYHSKVDVLICTPGRLVEHMGLTPGFTMDFVRWLVVDEADKLLSQNFQGWLEAVMAALRSDAVVGARAFPGSNVAGVRKVLLSATLTRDLDLLGPLQLRRPRLVVLEGEGGGGDGGDGGDGAEHVLPERLRETVVRVFDAGLKPLYLVELLEAGHLAPLSGGGEAAADDPGSPETTSGSDSDSDSDGDHRGPRSLPFPTTALVFTKSNEAALRLARLLALIRPALGPQIGTLTSATPTHARRRTIRAFAARKLRILIASDLVARGIDLPNLGHVVNYDLPASAAGYVHRVGRTARAGREGRAWTLLEDAESGWFWGRIGKADGVRRAAAVERVRVGGERGGFCAEKVEAYERALAQLGDEAEEGRRRAGRR